MAHELRVSVTMRVQYKDDIANNTFSRCTRLYIWQSALLLPVLLLQGCASDTGRDAWHQDMNVLQTQLETVESSQKTLGRKIQAMENRLTRLEKQFKHIEAWQDRLEKIRKEQKHNKKIRASAHVLAYPQHEKHKQHPTIKKASNNKKRTKKETGNTSKKTATSGYRSPPRNRLKKAAIPGSKSEQKGTTFHRHPDPLVPTKQERQDYFRAFMALKSGRYAEASRVFSTLIQNHPESKYTWQASYWLGEALYAQGKPGRAIDAFRRAANSPSGSPRRAAAMARLAQLYRQMGRKTDAKAVLLRLLREEPKSAEAETVKRTQ